MVVAAQLSGVNCHDCTHRDCDGSKGASWFVLDGEEIKYCPLLRSTAETNLYIKYYAHYKNGWLPADGGLLDQTARFLSAMAIIEAVVGEQKQSRGE